MAMSSTDPISQATSAHKRRLRDRLVVLGLVRLRHRRAGGARRRDRLGRNPGADRQAARLADRLSCWACRSPTTCSAACAGTCLPDRLGLPLGYLANFRHFLGGFAMSVTPGRLGELVRMRWIGRETGWRFERTAPLVLVDRASDLAARGLLLGVSLAFSATGIAFGLPVTLLALAGAIVATRPTLLRPSPPGATGRPAASPRLFAKIRRAAGTPRGLLLAGGDVGRRASSASSAGMPRAMPSTCCWPGWAPTSASPRRWRSSSSPGSPAGSPARRAGSAAPKPRWWRCSRSKACRSTPRCRPPPSSGSRPCGSRSRSASRVFPVAEKYSLRKKHALEDH